MRAMRSLWLLVLVASALPAQNAAPRIEILNYTATKQTVEFDLVNRADAPIAAVAIFFRPCGSQRTETIGTPGRPPYLAVDAPMDPMWRRPPLIAPGESRHMTRRNSLDCKLKLDRVSAAFTDGSVTGDPLDFERFFRALQLRRSVAERWLASARLLQAEAEPVKAVEELLAGLEKEHQQLTARPLRVDFTPLYSRTPLPWPAVSDGDSDRIRRLLNERNGTAARKRETMLALSNLTYLVRPLYDRLAPFQEGQRPPKPGEWRLDPGRRAALPKQEAADLIAKEIAWLEAENASLSWLSRFLP